MLRSRSRCRGGSRLAGLGLAAALLGGACVHGAGGGAAVPPCPGVLLPTGEIEEELRLRLRMRLRAAELDTSLELAVEKRGDRLVVVAFDPFGVKSFSLVQRDLAVEVEGLPSAALPTAPQNVLHDLHRVRFLALAPPRGGEGQVHAELAGVEITEQWDGGRLEWRRFEGDGRPVRVEFSDASARIDNPGCGYRATLVEVAAETRP